MKKMNYEDFSTRIKEVAKARKIFIPHITKNISIAFELYQEIFAEEKLDVFVSTTTAGNQTISPLDEYKRPVCDECNSELWLKVAPVTRDGVTYPTTWVCKECGIEYHTEKTAQEWMEELNHDGGREKV
jgi:RNase P subunit RPR2